MEQFKDQVKSRRKKREVLVFNILLWVTVVLVIMAVIGRQYLCDLDGGHTSNSPWCNPLPW